MLLHSLYLDVGVVSLCPDVFYADYVGPRKTD